MALKLKKYSRFLTVDELDAAFRKIVPNDKILVIGKSESGHDILAAKLGTGKKSALVFGFPHPNEPIGSLTCLELAKLIQNEPLLQKRFTWYIIPCADPNGAKMNEGWFKGKFSLKKYTRNFFRQQGKKQLYWSFPVKYKDYSFNKPIKPTKALQKLIDKTKPSFIYPLHNAGFGGAYFYLTWNMPAGYYNEILSMCKNLSVPVDMGEPETEYIKVWGKPFYQMISLAQEYEYFKSNGKNPLKFMDAGAEAIGYAKTKNPSLFGIVSEIPYLYDRKIFDSKKTKSSRKELAEIQIKRSEDLYGFIDETLSFPGINKKSIFYGMIKDKIKVFKGDTLALKNLAQKEEFSRKATVAEQFSRIVLADFYKSLELGHLRRLVLDSNDLKDQKKVLKRVDSKIDEFVSFIEKNSDYKVIPINSLVEFQVKTLIISLKYI